LRRDPDVEGAHHVRVLHPAGDLRLSLEAAAGLLVVEHLRAQDLDRELATDLHVLGAKHRPHRSGPELLADAIARGKDLPYQSIESILTEHDLPILQHISKKSTHEHGEATVSRAD